MRAKIEESEADYELAREVLAARLAAKMTQASSLTDPRSGEGRTRAAQVG